MMAMIRVKKGDSTDIQVITHKVDGVPVTDYTGYLLKMEVVDRNTGVNVGVARTISPEVGNGGFKLGLSPTDTSTLGVGEYLMAADLEKTVNGVVEFNRELVWDLVITPSRRG